MTQAVQLPPGLVANPRLAGWVRFNADRSVSIATGKVEIGQGIVTAMLQIAADELDVSLARLRLVASDTSRIPDEGQTTGSRSVNEGGMALRLACAEVRHLLLAEAARRLEVPLETLDVTDGIIHGSASRSTLSYWDLPTDALLERKASGTVAPKPALARSLVGTRVQRVDIPAKVHGRPSYVHDVELPGMLFGRVVRPPAGSARLVEFDPEPVRRMRGVVAVVRDGEFIGVVAEREEQAVAARALALRRARWEQIPLATDDAGIRDYLPQRASREIVVADDRATADAQPAADGIRRFEARYSKPYLAHASIGPSCALARVENGRIELWTQSQGIYPLRKELALVLRVDPESIVVHHVEGAGCYGHNGADDVALDAILLSRAVSGRPVQVQWMRDDEFVWEPYGPAMAMQASAALDPAGKVVDWSFDVWSNGHMHRPGSVVDAGRVTSLLAAWTLEDPTPRAPQADACQAGVPGSGCIARNIVPLYDFPRRRIAEHPVDELPLRVSSLRSTGAYGNVFAIESFVDELAVACGSDPVEFRLRHLVDPRARAVIESVADRSNWPAREQGEASGWGMAFARHRNRYAYFAIVVEVELEMELRVRQVYAAVDAGEAINPDGLVNQIEGGIVQSISWTLKEQVCFDRDGIASRDWDSYPILRFPEVPRIDVQLIDRPGEEPLGAGEAAMGPTAAAIANALHRAIGVRVRDLPITRDRIIAQMQ